jgi:hypothetical protein
MKKKIIVFGVLGILLSSSNGYAQNYTGDGGRGMSLAVNELEAQTPEDQQLGMLVQGYKVLVVSTCNIFGNKQAGGRGIYAENAKEISC